MKLFIVVTTVKGEDYDLIADVVDVCISENLAKEIVNDIKNSNRTDIYPHDDVEYITRDITDRKNYNELLAILKG